MIKGNKIIRTQNISRNEKKLKVLVLEDTWISENDILSDNKGNIYNILFYDTIEDFIWDDILKTHKRIKRVCVQIDNKIKTNVLYIS